MLEPPTPTETLLSSIEAGAEEQRKLLATILACQLRCEQQQATIKWWVGTIGVLAVLFFLGFVASLR